MKAQGLNLLYQGDGSLLLQISMPSTERAEARRLLDQFRQWTEKGREVECTLEPKKKPRSLDANALLWACITEIAQELRTDKWSVYLEMLKRYTKGTYVVCREKAVDAFMRTWRACEVIGDVEVNGKPAKQLLCYPGSSTLDRDEFRKLLNGVISEMEQMDLETPDQRKLKEIVDAYDM